MGYTTEFDGEFRLSRRLTEAETAEWGDTFGEDITCQWVLYDDEDGGHVQWDGAEKFYGYVEMAQSIATWLHERGVDMRGAVLWRGEETHDVGVLVAAGGLVAALPVREGLEALAETITDADAVRGLTEGVECWDRTWALR